MAPRKIDLALGMRGAISDFDDLATRLNELVEIYDDSGYAAGGSDPIIADDLVGHDITPADLASVKSFVNNLNKFLNDEVPAQFNYAEAINAFRTMPE